jgi:peptidoglycan-associated lipoprotein
MKTLSALTLMLLSFAYLKADAQDVSRADLALGYNYTHSNAPPDGCGCFHFNGGSVSASLMLNSQWRIAGEFGAAHAGSVPSSTLSPTMTTYLIGPRYNLTKGSHRVVPFANLLLGAAHVSDGYFPSGSSSSTAATAFAMAAGGGMDISLGKHMAVRPIEADYLLTRFPNADNSRQNNVSLTSGIVFRFDTKRLAPPSN